MKISHLLRNSFFMLLFFSICLLGISRQDSYSQTVSGKVTDENNDPLPGVTIMVVNTTTGTISDPDGFYSISPGVDNASLSFSFIGYETQIVQLNGRTSIDVQMNLSAQILEDVVVIGYGTVAKKDLTGAVAVISNEDLNRTPIPNISKAIQGKASGVTVLQTGAPGAQEVNIRVRGIGSISFDPDPLVVIDGVIGGDMNSIPPQDIESISILKDASSAAIYGANASHGVILITTKRGSSKKLSVTASAYTGMNFGPKQFNMMDATEYADFYNAVYDGNNIERPVAYSDSFREWYYGEGWQKGTSWQDEIMQGNTTGNYYLGISDGNERSNFSISANYNHEEGVLINTNAKRFSLRANSDFKVNEFIKIGETFSISRHARQEASGSAWNMVLESSPLMRVYNDDNLQGFEGAQIPYAYDVDGDGIAEMVSNTGGNDKFNPKGIIAIPENKYYRDNLLANMYLEIKPFRSLSFTTLASVTANFREDNEWEPKYDMGVRSVNNASLAHNFNKDTNYSWENKLAFVKSFGNHNINAIAVHHVRIGENSGSNVSAVGFPYEQLRVISQSDPAGRDATGGEGESAELSYLARLIYNYNSSYFVTTSIRRDGSSNFGPLNKWGLFPSVSFAWKVNEDFLRNVKQINMLKLRVGYGSTGNSNYGGFNYQTNLASLEHFSPVFGIDQVEVLGLNELWNAGNPKIKWEASDMTNFGFDVNAFANRIQFSAEYYIKNQDDLILEVPISSTFGKWDDTGANYNIAKSKNSGFEFDLRYNKMEGDFNYSLSANFTSIKNITLDLPSAVQSDDGNNWTIVGHTIGSLYGYVAERIIQSSDFDEIGNYLHAVPSEGVPAPGDLKFADLNMDGKITDLDRTVIGKGIPDFTYSFGVELYYKNFDLSVFMYGLQNADIFNTLRRDIESFESQDLDHNKSVDWSRNYYSEENPSTEYLRIDPNNTNLNTRISTWWVEDASFLRVKDIQIGYTMPKKWLQSANLTSARIYVSGMNLFTFTKYSGRDPESPLNSDEPLFTGVDSDAYPLPRTVTAGIQIDF